MVLANGQYTMHEAGVKKGAYGSNKRQISAYLHSAEASGKVGV